MVNKARNDCLVEENLKLVHFVIHKKFPLIKDVEYDDLFQIGCIGLIKAARKYEETRSQFSTYACLRICGELSKFVRDMTAQKRGGDKVIHRSLEEIVHRGDSEDITLLHMLSDPSRDFEQAEQRIDIHNAMTKLSPEEKKVVKLRMTGLSQKKIGHILGCSQVQVSRVERRAYKVIGEGAG